ncbi:hypothetical protein TUM4438_03000 [Shewanella sairae]|uniref:Uncharacterized protein n=2 Tax=Shewanella TaxID=22 RepID=A0ABQ4P070_9GAMM|nr:hypothetical protein [Shewanella sairae]MCL1131801.1 hypothetical protein [Shewanella sairae]GIU40833.1 hypothetical protein TUM4438_03000 [Shewanella sairae]
MKWKTSIKALSIASFVIAPITHAQQPTDILGLQLQMTPDEVIKLLDIQAGSKVTVGNINNPTPTDFTAAAVEVANEYQQKYSYIPAEQRKQLIEQVQQLRLGNEIKQISCSDKACDTAFLKANNIIWFIARFTDDGKLGNLSVRQNVSRLNAQTQKGLEDKYHPDEIWGDISQHRSASLNRLSKNAENLTIKLKNYPNEKLIEYKLYDYSLFDDVTTKEQALISEFDKHL